MLNHHVVLPRLRKVTIAVVYTWPGGVVSLWPVPYAEETRIACWKSARTAFELSKAQWVQMIWNPDRRDYDVAIAEGINTEPLWPDDLEYREALEARFRRQDHHHAGASLCPATPRACRIASIGFARSGMSISNFDRTSNHLPVPVAMFAKEHRTGAEIGPLRRDQLLSLRRAPFDTGPDVLITSYSIVAELSCFKVLSWPMPRHLLCSYFETSAAINGLDIVGLEEKRPGLLEACDLFAIPHMPKDHKKHLRDLILNNESYSDEQWREIADYNRDDVLLTIPLLEAIAPTIDVPAALFRGRYATAVVDMEARGIPISMRPSGRAAGAMAGAAACSSSGATMRSAFTTSAGSFKEDRFKTLADTRGWSTSWPRTADRQA